MNQPRTQASPAARPRPSMHPAKEARARVVAPVVAPGWVGAGCGVSTGAFALTLIDPPFLMAREWPWGEGDRNRIPSRLYRGGSTAVSETVARDEFETVLADQSTLPWAILLPG